MKNSKSNSQKIKKMTFVALFSAIAFIVSMIFPIKVTFLTLDFKDAVIAICGMLFGPVAGICVAVIVPCIELLISDTGLYGLIMNILSSVTFTLVSSLIYKYRKTILGAVIGLISAIPTTVGVMLLANLLVTPGFMKVDINTVIKLIPSLILPFNLVKSTLNAAFVMLLYKPISRAMKKYSGIATQPQKEEKASSFKLRSIVVTIASVAVLAVGFAVLFAVLGGKIK